MIRVSVIIPTFNRPSQLGACLAALVRSSYPRSSFEVIVVDDGGEYALDAVIAEAGQDLNVRLVSQSNTGPAGARNAGVQESCGDFLAFTDDDCVPEREWLSALVDRLDRDPSRIYGGLTNNALLNNVYATDPIEPGLGAFHIAQLISRPYGFEQTVLHRVGPEVSVLQSFLGKSNKLVEVRQ